MKDFVVSFLVLGLVLVIFAFLVKPPLVETKVVTVEKPPKIITKIKVVKAPMNAETRQALDEYYERRYGMRRFPK